VSELTKEELNLGSEKVDHTSVRGSESEVESWMPSGSRDYTYNSSGTLAWTAARSARAAR
jgi:hypothetical protein